MEAQSVLWAKNKQQALEQQLTGFWAQDRWDMKHCPLNLERKAVRWLHFKCQSAGLNAELKYGCWQKLIKGEWHSKHMNWIPLCRRLMSWLNECAPQAQSLLEKSLNTWLMSLRTYLVENHIWSGQREECRGKLKTALVVDKSDMVLTVFRQIYQQVEQFYDARSDFDKDIWDMDKMGAPPIAWRTHNRLDFTDISPSWLREAAKHFIRYKLTIRTRSAAGSSLTHIKKFSAFLMEHHPSLQAPDLNRRTIEGYLAHLLTTGLHPNTRHCRIGVLRQFLELCVREGWADVPDRPLIYEDDFPAVRHNMTPRFLPQEVLDQLALHLTDQDVPAYLRRMVMILLHTGMRISELQTLRLDCLTKDGEGDYWINFKVHKFKQDHRLPLPPDGTLIREIQCQIQEVRERAGEPTLLLFPGRQGKTVSQRAISAELNALAIRKNICDATGNNWHFTMHSFRHTCATNMINSGVALYDVQKWLAHRSPAMTNVYAKVHDATMKKAFQDYQKSLGERINIGGQIVDLNSVVDSAEYKLLKQLVADNRQALPNGTCTYPVDMGSCVHNNACLECPWFLTDASHLSTHKAQLRETEAGLAKAYQINSVRLIEKGEKDKASLQRMIGALEKLKGGHTNA